MHGPARDPEPGSQTTLADDPLLAEAAQLRALPTFPRAVREYTVGLAQFRVSLGLFNKLFANENRFRTLRYLLYLDADRELFGPDGGASYGRLLELCTRRQETSPRVLKTMLALLSLTSFVEARRGTTDGRLKFYHPTPRLLSFLRQRLACAARALDVLQPELQRFRMLQDDPDFMRRVLVSAGRGLTAGEPPTDRMPEYITFFGGQEGAAPLVLTVMLADIDGEPPSSRAAIAKRFSLSKTQVTNLISKGVREGFLTLDAAGVPAPTQHLRDSFRRWISIELASHARHMRPA